MTKKMKVTFPAGKNRFCRAEVRGSISPFI